MISRRLEQFAAGAGIIGALLTVTYIMMPPDTGTNSSAQHVVRVMTSDHEGVLAKNLIGTLSFFFFLFFLGSLYNTLRRAEGGTGWISLLMLSGGVTVTAVHAFESVVAYALAWHVGRDGNLAVVTALNDIENLVAYFYAVPLAVMLIAASLVVYHTRIMPRWLAWVGFAAAAVWLIGGVGVLDPQHGPLTAVGFGGGLVLFFVVWLPATSIFLMRHPGAAEAGATLAAEATPVGV